MWQEIIKYAGVGNSSDFRKIKKGKQRDVRGKRYDVRGAMSEIGDKIQEKCLAFGDCIIKLNDYLLEQASQKYDGGSQRADRRNKTQISYLSHRTSRVPVHLQSVAALANQLLRSGTSIGANNAEATSAISKADFKSKSYIALKEARESLYWLELLHRNNYLTDVQFHSLYADAEELVKIFLIVVKNLMWWNNIKHYPSYIKHL